MGIRITHGDVGTFAQFGLEAGKGEQKVRQAAGAADLARTREAAQAQQSAAAINASADINKAVVDANARREALEFQSFIEAESAKRSMAWDQEKIEIARQHDFQMSRERVEIENQMQTANELREKQKLEQRKSALDAAAARGEISPTEAQREKLRLDVGASSAFSPLFGKQDGGSALSRFAKNKGEATQTVEGPTERARIAPQQQDATALFNISNKPDVSAEDKADIREIIATGDRIKIRTALQVMQAKSKERAIQGLPSFTEMKMGGL